MTEQKREINAEKYIVQYLGESSEDVYEIGKSTLALLLRTYGKELLLEAAERIDVKDIIYEYIDAVDIDKTSITKIIEEL